MPNANQSRDWVAVTGLRVSREIAEKIDEQATASERTRVGQVRYLLSLAVAAVERERARKLRTRTPVGHA